MSSHLKSKYFMRSKVKSGISDLRVSSKKRAPDLILLHFSRACSMSSTSPAVQDRLHRMNMPNAPSPLCVQCTAGELDGIEHALLRCNKIKPGADFLLETLKSEIPDLTFERIKYLDFRCEDLLVPTYLTAATLSQLWISRYCTRNFSWQSVRDNVEQKI